MFNPVDKQPGQVGQEPDPNGPTSPSALRDMLDAVILKGLLVKLCGRLLGWALDRKDRVLRIRHRLALGDLADELLALIVDCDDGRSRSAALAIRDDNGLISVQQRNAAVGRTEIDADDSSHIPLSLGGENGTAIQFAAFSPGPATTTSAGRKRRFLSR